MYNIEDKVELRHGADQLGFQEGGPLLLQSTLPSEVTLMERGIISMYVEKEAFSPQKKAQHSSYKGISLMLQSQ